MSTVTVPRQRERQPRRLYALGAFVDRQVSRLQKQYLAEHASAAEHADAVATLAKLRRGIGKEVGELPELWQVTLEGLPAEPEFTTPGPTFEEQAAYTAITLYALHQQSRREGMHQPGRGLGAAVAILAGRSGNEVAVRRRFEALGTAEAFSEVVHHARGLLTQLRGENLGLDYGIFADQLYWLQWPNSASRVRLAWGRDYYRTRHRESEQNDPSTPDTDTDPGEDS